MLLLLLFQLIDNTNIIVYSRKQALNAHDVFTFCWSLFIYIKSHYVQISDDLVNSYHLLLVCIDYCFSAALSFDNFKEIINISFYSK